MDSSGASATVWLERDDLIASGRTSAYPKLESDMETDILIVGAGIAGLHIAYELLSAGRRRVTVIEDGLIGSGETGRTTGHLSSDNEYNEFLQIHGPEVTAQVAASQQGAIDRIAAIVEKHNIDCDFERIPGYMFQGLRLDSKGYKLDTLQQVWQAANETGKLDIELVDDAGIAGFPSGRSIKFNQQGAFHPTKYIKALAHIITNDLGGQIYENTHMNEYKDSGSEGGAIRATTANGKTIIADTLVMATNVPLQKLVIIDRLEAFGTYAVAFKIESDKVCADGTSALWWDLADPYHYVRVTRHKEPGYSLLVVGGEDDKVGQHGDFEDRYKRLTAWTRERWPNVLTLEYRWSGQVLDSVDGLAYIGLNPGTKNVYIHTGDNGDGLTYAAIGGELIRDLILGRENALESVYSPSRQFSTSHLRRALKALPAYIEGNLSDQIYYAKWITRCRKTTADIEDLAVDEGDVIRDGLHPVAVYKYDQGRVHRMTAVCPHLKGIVAWNSAEKSFDCPVHGSRFDRYGNVINGPAKGNLSSHRDIA